LRSNFIKKKKDNRLSQVTRLNTISLIAKSEEVHFAFGG